MMAGNSPFGYHFDMAARYGRIVSRMLHMRLAGSSYQCEDFAEDRASCHPATGVKKVENQGQTLISPRRGKQQREIPRCSLTQL